MSSPSYFNQTEIDRFAKNSGKPYSKKNPEQLDVGRLIYNTVYKKVNYWGERLGSELKYPVKKDTHWLTNHVATFKHYAWCRLFPDPKEQMIFFNVELMAVEKYMIIKIDCMFEGSTSLSSEKVEMFRKYVGGHTYKGQPVGEHRIALNQFDNWDDLIRYSKAFIKANLPVYHGVRKYLKTGKLPKGRLQNVLIRRNLTKSHVPSAGGNTGGAIQVDYESRYKSQKALGDAGEKLVIMDQERQLKAWGIKKKVKKVPDSFGYDIKSYDKQGDEIHIEVKTTTMKQNEPFFLSINELNTAQKDSKWVLYRIYEFSKKYNSGEYYEIDRRDFLDKFKKDAQVYKCYNPKKT